MQPVNDITNLVDASFGTRDYPDGPIQELYLLRSLTDSIPPLTYRIRNDFRQEDEECFTIEILPKDVPGCADVFSCNDNGSDAINYFCEITMCIEDDDGRFLSNLKA